jgi:hypothetical protein
MGTEIKRNKFKCEIKQNKAEFNLANLKSDQVKIKV